MPADHDLPHVDMTKEPSEVSTCTVEYLDYDVLDEYGWGLDDDDLFEKAAETDLDEETYGTFDMNNDEYILKAAEDEGHDWPFSCRESSCATCAAVVTEGEIDMTMNNILSDEETEDKNVRLTCVGKPDTDEVKLVYNARYLDYLQDRAHF